MRHPLVILVGVISIPWELRNEDVHDLHVVSGVGDMRIAIHFLHQNGPRSGNDGIEDSLGSLHSTIMCRRDEERIGINIALFTTAFIEWDGKQTEL